MIEATTEFHRIANGSVRPLEWQLGISFTKERSHDVSWFVLDSSVMDGPDLIAENPDKPVQSWDAYDYVQYGNRLVKLSYSRSVAFPYNVQSAIADWSLNNYDGLFSYMSADSPIADYILPARPARINVGFKESGMDTVQTFVGLTTEVPAYSGNNNELASFTAMDYLSEIGKQSLRNMVKLKDVSTDVAIAAILQQFGLEEYQYDLAAGTVVIPFVYFSPEKNAGNALRELVQIEDGALWCDESGVIHFENRSRNLTRTPSMALDGDNIIDITPSRTDDIVNVVRIQCDVRQVQNDQPVYMNANENGYSSEPSQDQWRINSGGTLEQWLTLDDPTWTINQPVLNGAVTSSYFKAVTLSGQEVTGRVTAHAELFSDSIKLTINNTNTEPVSISYLEIWGEPAKIVEKIDYEAQETDSIQRFGRKELTITDNALFGSYKNADMYAENILSKMAGYSPTIEVKVKYDPALQLQDVVALDYGEYTGQWQIVGVKVSLEKSLDATLTLQRFIVERPFLLDVSLLNGRDLLG